MAVRKLILNYVNTPTDTIDYEKEFKDYNSLLQFVEVSHPDFTSFQAIGLSGTPE